MLDFHDGSLHYTIVVRATTNLFGSFCQWVCFDLGRTSEDQSSTNSTATATVLKTSSSTLPMIQLPSVLRAFGAHTRFVRCLLLETSARSTREQVTRLRNKLRFTPNEHQQSDAHCGHEDATSKPRSSFLRSLSVSSSLSRTLDENLAAAECGFNRPLEELVTQDVMFAELNRDNYRHHMRHLLTLELLAEQRVLTMYVFLSYEYIRLSNYDSNAVNR